MSLLLDVPHHVYVDRAEIERLVGEPLGWPACICQPEVTHASAT